MQLRTIFQSKTPLNGRVKDSPPLSAKNNVIYHFKCHCKSEYIGRTSLRFHRRKDQHVPKYIRDWMQGTTKNLPKRSTAPTSTGDHLIKNPDCARMYNDECFTFLARAGNEMTTI